MNIRKLLFIFALLFVLPIAACDSDNNSVAQPVPAPMPTPFPMEICPCDASEIPDLVNQADSIDCLYNLFTITLTAKDSNDAEIGIVEAACDPDGTGCSCIFNNSGPEEDISLEQYNNCFWETLDRGVVGGTLVNKIGQCETDVIPSP